LLFENSKESSKYISGVIFYDETIKQKDDNGVLFTKVLHDNGIVSGIKVDLGQLHIPFTKELRTIGLDDLDKRCKNYYSLGARFAKWRGQIDIDAKNNIPSKLAIEEQCSHLARYASICQLNGLVPIVEPEVMVLEGDHDIHTSYEITERVLHKTFKELKKHNVCLELMILKPNFVLAGKNCSTQPSNKEITELTLKVFKRTVPSAVPGIFFLSGGLSEKQSRQLLNEINKTEKLPWVISFSYGRALQDSCLKTWVGKKENVKKAQEAYLEVAKLCYNSALGKSEEH